MKGTPDLFDQIISSPFAIGLAGAITAMFSVDKLPLWQRISMAISGTFSAGFGTPAVCAWIDIDRVEYMAALAFVIGMIGRQIVRGAILLGEDIQKNPSKYIPAKWKK